MGYETVRSHLLVRRSASAALGVRRQGVSSCLTADCMRRQPGHRIACPARAWPARKPVPHHPHGSVCREPRAALRMASASSGPWVIANGRYRIRHASKHSMVVASASEFAIRSTQRKAGRPAVGGSRAINPSSRLQPDRPASRSGCRRRKEATWQRCGFGRTTRWIRTRL